MLNDTKASSTYEKLRGLRTDVLLASEAHPGKSKRLVARLLLDEGWSLIFVVQRYNGTEIPVTSLAEACRVYDREVLPNA